MKTNLAIFDLDHTLLRGDSDYLWGQFLVAQGLVDAADYETRNRAFYEQYKAGTLNIDEFAEFSLAPLAANDPDQLNRLRQQFVQEQIEPIIAEAAPALLERHRLQGDELLIMTSTNAFITAPIAEMLGIDTLLATEPECIDGRFTGRIAGTPCFRDGKVTRLAQWIEEQAIEVGKRWFYSDSHNDLPLLEAVEHPVAVDPDDALRDTAQARGWPVISLVDSGLSVSHDD